MRTADPAQLGAIAAAAGVALSNLQRKGPALEEVFLDLVNGTRVHSSVAGAPSAEGAAVDAEVPAAASDPDPEPAVDPDTTAEGGELR